MSIFVRLCSYKFLYHRDRKSQHPSPISFENKCYISFFFWREWINGLGGGGGIATQIEKKLLIIV